MDRIDGTASNRLRPSCGLIRARLLTASRERFRKSARLLTNFRASVQETRMPNSLISPYALPLLLLLSSNVFMTTAWYWHLRFKEVPLWQVVLISWGLAFIEYCLAVPANR
jgi:hypothetical protein